MTLIVSASYDDSHRDWYERLPEPKVRVDTSKHGGYVSGALIDTYRFGPKADSYLVIQDTMEPLTDDPAAPFREAAEKTGVPVVAWARFPFFFDNGEQQGWVAVQYPWILEPEHGIFGPVFYITRKVMDRLDKLGRFPKAPTNKNEANGTERAWAFALKAIGITPAYLHEWSEPFLASGNALPFRKVYAGRQ
jgi:hypothetical protein